MTLEQLRIFIAVAEREHMTRAAEFLALTQSAVSHAIMTLEAEFGLKLFNRIGRRVILTEIGTIFLEEARAVQSRARAAQDHIRNLTEIREGRLVIWASQTLGSYWLPARINRFISRHPDIRIEVVLSNTEEIRRHLLEGTITFGLVEGTQSDPALVETRLAQDQLVLVVGPDHIWATHTPEKNQLRTSPWILREKGSGTRAAFENTLKTWGQDLSELVVLMELTSNEAIANIVSSGTAATVLSASVVMGPIENGLLHKVDIAFPDRAFSLLTGKRILSPVEQAFTAALQMAG